MHLFVTFYWRQCGFFQDPIELQVQLKSVSSIVWNVASTKIPVGAWIIVVHNVDLERKRQATPDCHFDSIGLWLIVYTGSCSSSHGLCSFCFNDNDIGDYDDQHHQPYLPTSFWHAQFSKVPLKAIPIYPRYIILRTWSVFCIGLRFS